MTRIIAGLLALGLVLGTTTHAEAAPLFIAALGFIGVVGIPATILGNVLALVAGLGLSYLSQRLLQRRPNQGPGGTTGKMQVGGTVARSFPVGEKAVVTHSLVYANTFGQDGKTPNAYLVQVFALSDLPVGGGNAGLKELWVNGSQVTWNAGSSPAPATEGVPIPEFNKDGKDHLWIRFYDGTQTGADSRLVALFGSDTDRPYPATRVATGMAYAVCVSRLNRELFGGFPSFKFVLKGVNLYDPREDTTAGGSGSQRWNSPATWTEAPANPAQVIYSLLRGVQYDSAWFFGGQTISEAQLPISAWAAAMNECEASVALNTSPASTEPQFACSGEVRLDMEPAQVIKDLLAACNGRLSENGGVYKPHVGAAGAAVMSITDDDILITEGQTFEPFKSIAEQINGVTAKYLEPAEGWTAKDAPAFYNPDLEAEDGGRRQLVDFSYDYVTSGTQVQRLMRAAVLEARRERRHIIRLPADAYILEPNDFLSWSSDRNGYVSKLFRVDAVQDLANGIVALNLTEVDTSDYDWDETTDEQPIVIAPTPLVFPPPQSIGDWDAEPVTISGTNGRAKPGIRLVWDGTDQDDVIGVEFEVRKNGETALVYTGQTSQSTVAEGQHDISANLISATAYEVRGRFVPGSARETEWSDWIDVVTPDVRVSYQDVALEVQGIFTDLNARIKDANDKLRSLSLNLSDAIAKGFTEARSERQKMEIRDGDRLARIEETRTIAVGAETSAAQVLEEVEAAREGETTLLANVTSIRTALTDGDDSLAAWIASVSAQSDPSQAYGNIQISAVSGVSGALAAIEMKVRAGDQESDDFAEAAIRMLAVSYSSPADIKSVIQLKADQTQFLGEDGTPFAVFDGQTRELVIERIGSGRITTYYEFERTEPTSDGAVGSGTTASNAGNSYIDSSSLGTITVPENPDAIGDGATDTDYCPVLFAVNATARNGSTGWGFGSANPMVVAFRVKLTDGVNTFYSEEGLIACASSWNGAPVYGFGGNPGSMTGVSQVKAGTYDVYLQYRWGPRTANGMTATATEPAGLQLRIAAKIVALILKK